VIKVGESTWVVKHEQWKGKWNKRGSYNEDVNLCCEGAKPGRSHKNKNWAKSTQGNDTTFNPKP